MQSRKEAIADQKANVVYAAAVHDLEHAALPAAVGAKLAVGLEDPNKSTHRMGRREAWERLCILTESDDVDSILEYWEVTRRPRPPPARRKTRSRGPPPRKSSPAHNTPRRARAPTAPVIQAHERGRPNVAPSHGSLS